MAPIPPPLVLRMNVWALVCRSRINTTLPAANTTVFSSSMCKLDLFVQS